MAHVTANDFQARGFLAGLNKRLTAWREDVARHRVFNQTYRELASLTDRELNDIGLGRSDIVDVAWDAAYRI